MKFTTKPLGEVSKFIRGITFKPEDLIDTDADDAVVCMRTKNIQTDLDESDLIAIPSNFVRRNEQLLEEGDMLVSTANSWELVGKTCWVPSLIYAATAGGFISILRADRKKVSPRYLYHWMICGETQHKLRYCGRQTTNISNMSFELAEKLEIPLPSLDEQRSIAAILDKADAIRRKRMESIRLTEEFLRFTFLEMFGDPVTNPKGWDQVPIKDLGEVMTGNTPSREVQEYYGEGIEWIKSNNINTPFHFLTEAKEHLTEVGQKIGRMVPENSILVTCIAGSPECIGNAAIANRPVAFNQQINAVTPFKETDPYFLYVQILVAKKLIQGQSTESMKGMVSKGKFENIPFLKPPANMQSDFGKLFMRIHRMTQRTDASNLHSHNLFNSLTQRAFRGEL